LETNGRSSSIGTERWHEESFATSQCMRNEKRKELLREKKRMEFFGLSQELMSAQELICQQLIQ
jgi:hypothetical protein